MPRIRTIKPEYWTNPQVGRCSYPARLLFIGTWHYADDHGNLPRDAGKLMMQVFPNPADRGLDVEALILELLTQGLLMEYSCENKQRYLHIPTFTKHQVINRPSKALYPQPDKTLTEEYMRTVNAAQDKAERESHRHSQKAGKTQNKEGLTEDSCLERKGKEVNLKPSQKQKHVELSLDHTEHSLNGRRGAVEKIFGYWCERMKSPRSALSDKRRRMIVAALKLHTPADLCKAIRGCSRDPWHMGQNEQGRVFNSLELILRDEQHIEQFMAFDATPPQPGNGQVSSRQDRRRKTAEAFGFVAGTTSDEPETIDLPPEDCHVVTKH
jgi:hypothetical protein